MEHVTNLKSSLDKRKEHSVDKDYSTTMGCEGCAIFVDGQCNIVAASPDLCPCKECVLKVMCSEFCDEFKDSLHSWRTK